METREFWGTVYLLLPLLGGGIFHGLCMKHGWLAFLKHPIDRGAQWRNRRLFGANKTYRGLVAVGLGSSLVLGLQADVLHRWPQFRALELFDYAGVNGWLLGFAVGFAAMLAELPNSFLKRQFDVPPGKGAAGGIGILFYLLDQVDLLIGAWLVFALTAPIKPAWVAFSLLLVTVVHQLLSWVTYRLGMRATPR